MLFLPKKFDFSKDSLPDDIFDVLQKTNVETLKRINEMRTELEVVNESLQPDPASFGNSPNPIQIDGGSFAQTSEKTQTTSTHNNNTQIKTY